MPIDIEGWIEYSPYKNKEDQNEEHSWMPWMDISSVVSFNDEVNWILFGNPRDFKTNDSKFKPLAKNRGFPTNPSCYLKLDINLIHEHENKHGKGELFGFTFLKYSEIERIDWDKDHQVKIEESDWGKLFNLINTFRDLKNIKSEQIRLVVWYNW